MISIDKEHEYEKGGQRDVPSLSPGNQLPLACPPPWGGSGAQRNGESELFINVS